MRHELGTLLPAWRYRPISDLWKVDMKTYKRYSSTVNSIMLEGLSKKVTAHT